MISGKIVKEKRILLLTVSVILATALTLTLVLCASARKDKDVGDNELESDSANLKCMSDGTQTEVSLSEFCEGFERAYMNNAVAAFENADFSELTQVDINNLLK